MPASFKVLTVFRDGNEANGTEEILDPDFGEAAIGRVAPVDSGNCFSWLPSRSSGNNLELAAAGTHLCETQRFLLSRRLLLPQGLCYLKLFSLVDVACFAKCFQYVQCEALPEFRTSTAALKQVLASIVAAVGISKIAAQVNATNADQLFCVYLEQVCGG
jgi:hypothetical protein